MMENTVLALTYTPNVETLQIPYLGGLSVGGGTISNRTNIITVRRTHCVLPRGDVANGNKPVLKINVMEN